VAQAGSEEAALLVAAVANDGRRTTLGATLALVPALAVLLALVFTLPEETDRLSLLAV